MNKDQSPQVNLSEEQVKAIEEKLFSYCNNIEYIGEGIPVYSDKQVSEMVQNLLQDTDLLSKLNLQVKDATLLSSSEQLESFINNLFPEGEVMWIAKRDAAMKAIEALNLMPNKPTN